MSKESAQAMQDLRKFMFANLYNNPVAKSEEKIKIIDSTAKLSNIRILLHSHYIKNGHVKNQDELEKFVQEYQWVKNYHKKKPSSTYADEGFDIV